MQICAVLTGSQLEQREEEFENRMTSIPGIKARRKKGHGGKKEYKNKRKEKRKKNIHVKAPS